MAGPSDPQRIGPGCLVLVVGPSGAGKDTLIASVRHRLAAAGTVAFPTRVVTRPPDRTEHVVAVSEPEFAAAEAQGAFALSWRAHGLAYGVPRAIDEAIREGRTVVVNVSRTVVPEAGRRYARLCVVMVDAPAEVRAARLLARGRESGPGVAGRLDRSRGGDITCEPHYVIDNGGDIERAAEGFAAILERVSPCSADDRREERGARL